MTSTDRERLYAGGIMAHDMMGSGGGIARSFGRGSVYEDTEMR